MAVEKEKVSMTLAEKEYKKKESESKPQETTQEQPPISQRAQEWASENEWFGTDRVMTSAAMGIHEDVNTTRELFLKVMNTIIKSTNV